jgi:hypothetical protein
MVHKPCGAFVLAVGMAVAPSFQAHASPVAAVRMLTTQAQTVKGSVVMFGDSITQEWSQ